MEKSILIIENDKNFLSRVVKMLELENYKTLRASSEQEARQKLEKEYFHLILSDIRLIDDDDSGDKSGLVLMRNERYKPVPKIFTTRYPNKTLILDALKSGPDAQQLAIDFHEKENLPSIVGKIKSAFENFVKINFDLKIKFSTPHSFYEIADHIYNSELTQGECQNRADEIEGLLRRIFYEKDNRNSKDTLLIDDIIKTGDAQILMLVKIKREDGTQQPASLIRCGRRNVIELEKDAYNHIYKGKLVKPWAMLIDETKLSINCGIIKYLVSGADIEDLLWLPDFYKMQESKEFNSIIRSIEKKARSTLYYQPCQPAKSKTYDQLYKEFTGFRDSERDNKLFRDHFKKTFEYLANRFSVYVGGKFDEKILPLSLPDGTRMQCRNPALVFSENKNQLSESAILRFSIGNLSNHDILIDKDKRPWIACFRKIGPAPPFADFVAFESKMRFEWSDFPKSDFNQLIQFEKLLTDKGCAFGLRENAKIISNEISGLKQITDCRIKKAIDCINTLRQIAVDRYVASPEEYFMGIFFQAASVMIHNPTPDRKAHALLAMAMICRHEI